MQKIEELTIDEIDEVNGGFLSIIIPGWLATTLIIGGAATAAVVIGSSGGPEEAPSEKPVFQ